MEKGGNMQIALRNLPTHAYIVLSTEHIYAYSVFVYKSISSVITNITYILKYISFMNYRIPLI